MKKSINILYPDDLELFPSYEKYFFELKKLESFDFSSLNPEEIYHTFYDYAKILPTEHTFMYSKEFNDILFYRVRLNINEQKEDISSIQTYSNPPTFFCNKNGRANLKHKSVFYCSDDPICSILENNPKEGDEGFLSIWNGKAINDLKLGVFLPPGLPHLNDWYYISNHVFNLNNNHLEKKYKDISKHLKLLNSFIADKFLKEKEPYPITSMISDEVFFGSDLWRDFIVYPSRFNVNSCNMAFHPNTAFNSLSFQKVIKFKIDKIHDNGINCRLGETGELLNNKIIWRKRSDEESNIFKMRE